MQRSEIRGKVNPTAHVSANGTMGNYLTPIIQFGHISNHIQFCIPTKDDCQTKPVYYRSCLWHSKKISETFRYPELNSGLLRALPLARVGQSLQALF
jgi:hypothetical protein